MKTKLLITSLLLGGIANAQTYCSQHAAYGDSLTGTTTTYDTSVYVTSPVGSGVTWNYASLVVDTTGVISHYYYDPSTTPGSSSFPGADLADLTPVGQYTYSQHFADSSNIMGIWSAPLGCTVQLLYDQQKSICPFAFGNSYTDAYSGYVCGANAYAHNSGTRKYTFDGTGKLILPTITYNNVNRVMVVDSSLDSSFVGSGVFTGASSSISHFYLWIDATNNQVVFSMLDLYSVTYNFTYKVITWSDYTHVPSMVTSVRSSGAASSELNIYPNPFNASAKIRFNKPVSNARLNIYDVYGQQVKIADHISGDEMNIDRNELPSGIYFVRLTQDDKMISTDKLIITD